MLGSHGRSMNAPCAERSGIILAATLGGVIDLGRGTGVANCEPGRPLRNMAGATVGGTTEHAGRGTTMIAIDGASGESHGDTSFGGPGRAIGAGSIPVKALRPTIAASKPDLRLSGPQAKFGTNLKPVELC